RGGTPAGKRYLCTWQAPGSSTGPSCRPIGATNRTVHLITLVRLTAWLCFRGAVIWLFSQAAQAVLQGLPARQLRRQLFYFQIQTLLCSAISLQMYQFCTMAPRGSKSLG